MLTHNLHNFSELEDRIILLHMQQKEVNTTVVSLESQIRHLQEMLKYAEQYQKNKIFSNIITPYKLSLFEVISATNHHLHLLPYLQSVLEYKSHLC